MKLFSITLLLILMAPFLAVSQTQKWGESGAYTKWYRYPYETGSTYQFRQVSPSIEQFPTVIKVARQPDIKPQVIYDRQVAVSQLRTISRCKFDTVTYVSDVEAEHRKAIDKWNQWWEVYGKEYSANYRKHGRQYPKAWSLLPGTSGVACPAYPILLPETWSTTIKFQSGDYGAAIQEEISMSVSKNETWLTRRYTHGWPGSSKWKHEEWKDLSHNEAQQFLAMLIYSIDNPWLYAKESIAVNKDNEFDFGSIRGRTENWWNYYPNAEWTGIKDAKGNIIINDDVWSWHTNDHKNFGTTMLPEAIGVVFRVVVKSFPDSNPRPANSRWVAIDAPTIIEPAIPRMNFGFASLLIATATLCAILIEAYRYFQFTKSLSHSQMDTDSNSK